jgi:anti-anti-sigma factor
MVLDLACVSAMDGAGIGLLASLQGSARSTGSRLLIQNPSHRVRQLLRLTNLDSVLEIFPSREFAEICHVLGDSQEEALASCAH